MGTRPLLFNIPIGSEAGVWPAELGGCGGIFSSETTFSTVSGDQGTSISARIIPPQRVRLGCVFMVIHRSWLSVRILRFNLRCERKWLGVSKYVSERNFVFSPTSR